MRKKVMEALGGARAYGKVFLKMTALSALMGVACGGLGGVFHHAVEVSGYLFREHGWLLYLLPLAGMAIVWLYRAAEETLDHIDSAYYTKINRLFSR